MPDRYGDDMAEALRQGIRVVKMDLIPLMTAMGLATSRIGLGGTYSTTYFEPFHVARVFSTLDHMTGGRAAWNVVTSLNDSEAANFGRTEHPPHDRRYDRADEFMEVVLGNWDAWEDGSVLYDRDGLGFADPARVHRLDYEGEWFRTRGTFTVPWTPQGRPVIIQAGQSGRGREFAARWGEILFVIYPSLEFGRPVYRDMKAEIAAAGRDPNQVTICPAVYCVTGETRAIARGQGGVHRGARDAARHPRAPRRGLELRLRGPPPGRAADARPSRFDDGAPGDPRPGSEARRGSTRRRATS